MPERKGRIYYGQEHHWSKLTEIQVREIRDSASSNKDLGVKYGVTPDAIRSIRKRRNWRHI